MSVKASFSLSPVSSGLSMTFMRAYMDEWSRPNEGSCSSTLGRFAFCRAATGRIPSDRALRSRGASSSVTIAGMASMTTSGVAALRVSPMAPARAVGSRVAPHVLATSRMSPSTSLTAPMVDLSMPGRTSSVKTSGMAVMISSPSFSGRMSITRPRSSPIFSVSSTPPACFRKSYTRPRPEGSSFSFLSLFSLLLSSLPRTFATMGAIFSASKERRKPGAAMRSSTNWSRSSSASVSASVRDSRKRSLWSDLVMMGSMTSTAGWGPASFTKGASAEV
mmetsp:Transcript_34322/g.85020  ORF Transcript_34322/g.85020 Transcript_34322/m.85020 type:complete len:277 (-) Transcript_34322:3858-4688(-)